MIPILNRVNSNINFMYQNLWALDKIAELHNKKEIEPKGEKIMKKFSFDVNMVIDDVHFSFNNDRCFIFNNLSKVINAGETIGISGQSGSGKSTLASIITGLITPTKGNILFDGVNIDEIDKDSLHSSISFVSQQNFMFDDSILNNIIIDKNTKYSIEKLNQIIDITHLNSFIESLPEGINTKIGENGTKISGGQKQRISIARSLYSSPKLIILDEPTSALDNQRAYKIIKDIIETFPKMTIILISHDDKILSYCDKIINIEDYKISENQ